YEWAAAQVDKEDNVVDCGCGVGYGAAILGRSAKTVFAFDRDADAIGYARQNYAMANVGYVARPLEDAEIPAVCGTAVAFEIIEHIENPSPLLRRLAKTSKPLFASVPNEKVSPFKNYRFHFRHYTREEFLVLLNDCGWLVEEWWGQVGPESDVE